MLIFFHLWHHVGAQKFEEIGAFRGWIHRFRVFSLGYFCTIKCTYLKDRSLRFGKCRSLCRSNMDSMESILITPGSYHHAVLRAPHPYCYKHPFDFLLRAPVMVFLHPSSSSHSSLPLFLFLFPPPSLFSSSSFLLLLKYLMCACYLRTHVVARREC